MRSPLLRFFVLTFKTCPPAHAPDKPPLKLKNKTARLWINHWISLADRLHKMWIALENTSAF
jgi:hypothetical protein